MIDIKNLEDHAEIYIYGVIIDDTDASYLNLNEDSVGFVFPAKIREDLDKIGNKPINLHIASDGGNVAAGVALYNLLSAHNSPLTVYIDAWAASIASYLAFVGDKIVMPENTFLMIHNPSGGAFGEAGYLRSVADWLDKLKMMIAGKYAENSASTVEIFLDLMDKETWLTANEAKEYFGDKIEIIPSNDIKAVACYSALKSAPEALKKPVDVNIPTNEENAVKNDLQAVNEDIYNNIISVIQRSYDYEAKSRNVTED